jgi:hypothetical protein
MIILPAITCGIAIVLMVVFEIGYNFVAKRWITPLDKQEWFMVFWGLIVACLLCCKILPVVPPDSIYWIPFVAVVGCHMYMVCSGGSSWRRRDPSPPAPPGANSSTARHLP